MAYRYRNLKTEEVITTTNKVSGKNWVPADDTQKQPLADGTSEKSTAEKAPVKPSRKEKK